MQFNDMFAQYIRACKSYPSKKLQEARRKEVESCNHEFVLLQPANYVGACNSSDCVFEDPIVECVHCGLTNKFIDFYKDMKSIGFTVHDGSRGIDYLNTRADYSIPKIPFLIPAIPFDTVLYNEMKITNKFNARHKFFGYEEVLDSYQITNKSYAINSSHIGILYQIAKQISSGNDSEILSIMKSLHELETDEEKFTIFTIDDASDLKERYKKTNIQKKMTF